MHYRFSLPASALICALALAACNSGSSGRSGGPPPQVAIPIASRPVADDSLLMGYWILENRLSENSSSQAALFLRFSPASVPGEPSLIDFCGLRGRIFSNTFWLNGSTIATDERDLPRRRGQAGPALHRPPGASRRYSAVITHLDRRQLELDHRFVYRRFYPNRPLYAQGEDGPSLCDIKPEDVDAAQGRDYDDGPDSDDRD